MDSLNDIRRAIAPEIAELDARIRRQLASQNALMNDVIDNYLRTKGKQIRPIVVMLTAKMFGRVDDKVLSAAAAVELLHNASLIHDDVVDGSDTRHGVPTINAIWDNHIAVLVGDFFVSSAMQQAIATNDIRVIDALCSLGKALSLGELDQIYNARYHTIDEAQYMHVISYKTASLFVACAKMGCLAAGVDDDRLDTMARFAELLGLCFQIRDDIFDYYDDAEIGKPTGNDLREGKVTLPLIYALSQPTPEAAEMRALVAADSLDAAQIDTLIRFARDNGGIDYAYDAMHRMRDRAVALLDSLPACESRRMFVELFDFIIARRS